MTELIEKCLKLHDAYKRGLLGNQEMPEDTHPNFTNEEEKLAFFTLPMALNYQRNSYKLWISATNAYDDRETRKIFSIEQITKLSKDDLRLLLTKHKVALQPNKHTDTWHRIGNTIAENWGTISNLLKESDHDFLKLQKAIQVTHKKGFPYLSGPKSSTIGATYSANTVASN